MLKLNPPLSKEEYEVKKQKTKTESEWLSLWYLHTERER